MVHTVAVAMTMLARWGYANSRALIARRTVCLGHGILNWVLWMAGVVSSRRLARRGMSMSVSCRWAVWRRMCGVVIRRVMCRVVTRGVMRRVVTRGVMCAWRVRSHSMLCHTVVDRVMTTTRCCSVIRTVVPHT